MTENSHAETLGLDDLDEWLDHQDSLSLPSKEKAQETALMLSKSGDVR